MAAPKPPTKHGYLLKRGKVGLKAFKQRWFVLEENVLSYSKKIGGPPIGTIPLSLVKDIISAPDSLAFDLKVQNDDDERTYYFKARSAGEAEEWLDAIRKSQLFFDRLLTQDTTWASSRSSSTSSNSSTLSLSEGGGGGSGKGGGRERGGGGGNGGGGSSGSSGSGSGSPGVSSKSVGGEAGNKGIDVEALLKNFRKGREDNARDRGDPVSSSPSSLTSLNLRRGDDDDSSVRGSDASDAPTDTGSAGNPSRPGSTWLSSSRRSVTTEVGEFPDSRGLSPRGSSASSKDLAVEVMALQEKLKEKESQIESFRQLVELTEQRVLESQKRPTISSENIRERLEAREAEVADLRAELSRKQEKIDELKAELTTANDVFRISNAAASSTSGGGASPMGSMSTSPLSSMTTAESDAMDMMKSKMAEMKEAMDAKTATLKKRVEALETDNQKLSADVSQWKSMAQKELKARLQLETEKSVLQKELGEVKRQSELLRTRLWEMGQLHKDEATASSHRSGSNTSSRRNGGGGGKDEYSMRLLDAEAGGGSGSFGDESDSTEWNPNKRSTGSGYLCATCVLQ